MDKTDSKRYEAPKVIVSLDALDMINDADGIAVGGCGSSCARHEAPHTGSVRGDAREL